MFLASVLVLRLFDEGSLRLLLLRDKFLVGRAVGSGHWRLLLAPCRSTLKKCHVVVLVEPEIVVPVGTTLCRVLTSPASRELRRRTAKKKPSAKIAGRQKRL